MILSMAFLLILLLPSCKKKTPEPLYPQLIGAWLQSTDQDSIYLYVDNIEGTLFITSMVARVTGTGDFTRYSMASTYGLASLNDNNYFYLLLSPDGPKGPTYIDGTFNPTTMVVVGNFAYYILGDTLRTNYPYTIQRP